MSDTPTLAQRIGQTENALRALLEALLAENKMTYAEWVTLTLIARYGATVQQEPLVRQISAVLKCDTPTVLGAIDAMAARGLVAPSRDNAASVTLTPDGDVQYQHVRQRIALITGQLYGDLPTDELAVTHRVLDIVTARANEELSRQR